MADSIKVTDVTVEKAVKKGLRQLGVQEDKVTITVVREAKKGLFGFGKQDAIVELRIDPTVDLKDQSIENSTEVVKISVDDVVVSEIADETTDSIFSDQKVADEIHTSSQDQNYEQVYAEAIKEASKYLQEVANVYGATVKVNVEAEKEHLTFKLESDKAGLLIGKHGKILNALQVLTQTIVHRYVTGKISVLVDIENYRDHRSEMLKQIADRTAAQVLRTKQPVFLEPLPAYERKQIHAYLSKNKRISTHSEGKEPHRYLVVELAKS